jgi:hypothetical protein
VEVAGHVVTASEDTEMAGISAPSALTLVRVYSLLRSETKIGEAELPRVLDDAPDGRSGTDRDGGAQMRTAVLRLLIVRHSKTLRLRADPIYEAISDPSPSLASFTMVVD